MCKYLILIVLVLASASTALARKIVLACVDCYSSASLSAHYAAEYVRAGDELEWILIKTHGYSADWEKSLGAFPWGTPTWDWNPENPEELGPLVSRLQQRGVTKILGGMDKGTYEACHLNDAMRRASSPELAMHFDDNPFEFRDLLRKKKEMAEASGKYGIPTHILTDVDQGMKFVRDFSQPTVTVKFNAGAAGVGLQFVDKTHEPFLRAILEEKLRNKPTGLFENGDSIILQPRIIGREFFVNTYTWNGETVITGLWEYYKIDMGGTTVYFVDRPLPLDGALARELGPIMSTINLRLKKNTGPAHIEMILEASSGLWYLIENNARVAGSFIPDLEREIWGMSHLDLFVLSFLDPERFEREFKTFRQPSPRKMLLEGANFVVPSRTAGRISAETLAEIHRLPTFHKPRPQYTIQAGKQVSPTRDLRSAAMVLRFKGGKEEVKSDLDFAVRSLAQDRLIVPNGECADAIISSQEFGTIVLERASQVLW